MSSSLVASFSLAASFFESSGHHVEQGYGLTGVDSSPSLIAMCRKRFPDQEWIVADMRELPALGSFDLVTCLDDGLNYLTSEAELAGVLGHEIGHVIARHSSERLAKQQLTQGLLGALVVGSGDYTTAQIGQVVGNMINMSYGRDDELESDALGIRIMAEAGYDPGAMIGVMEKLAKASGGSRQPEFFSTHPHPANRAEKIREEIAKRARSGG